MSRLDDLYPQPPRLPRSGRLDKMVAQKNRSSPEAVRRMLVSKAKRRKVPITLAKVEFHE